MTTKVDGSSPAVIVPSHDEAHAASPGAPAPAASSREANQLSSWSSPAADAAVESIESSYGFGLLPDMESIDTELGKLDGFALLKTLNKLDADGKLERVLNRMTPDERQKVINQAVKGNLLERDRSDKLKAKFEMPGSFQTMVDELNTLSSREKPKAAFTYNWSAYQEDAYDVAKRKFGDQIATLKPGDSIQIEAKLGGSANHLTGAAESTVDVKRGADGKFTLGAQISAELGPELKHEKSGVQLEALLGGGGRVEYKFDTAEEAKAAAELFATMPPEALAKFGKPSAIELEGKVAAEAAKSFGVAGVKLAKVKGAEAASLTLRVELDKKQPELALIAEAKVDGKILQNAKAGPVSVQVHGFDGHARGKIELEVRTKISDLEKFTASPIDYVGQRGPELAANARAKVTLTNELAAGHHSVTNELKITGSVSDAQTLVARLDPAMSKAEMVMNLGKGVDVELREKKSALQHYGLDLKVDTGAHADLHLGAGYERKTVESDRVLYKGTATDFVSGRP